MINKIIKIVEIMIVINRFVSNHQFNVRIIKMTIILMFLIEITNI